MSAHTPAAHDDYKPLELLIGQTLHRCPVCGGSASLIAELVKALNTAAWALREPIDGWKGEVSRKALDEIGAVLAKVPK